MGSLGFGLVVRQTQRLAQSLRLTQTQRLLVQEHAIGIRLQLIEALRDINFQPRGDCPHCFRKMTPAEIVRGFSRDPNDYTTECSGCHKRFEPKLIAQGTYQSRIELPFYCSMQTLEQLRHIEPLETEQFARQHAAIYNSAVFHHGGLRQAYAKIGVQFPFEEVPDWKRKIESFLGRVPDTLIATVVDKSVKAIRTLRNQLGIPPYNVHVAVEEMEAAM